MSEVNFNMIRTNFSKYYYEIDNGCCYYQDCHFSVIMHQAPQLSLLLLLHVHCVLLNTTTTVHYYT